MKELFKLLAMFVLMLLMAVSCSDNKTEFVNRYPNNPTLEEKPTLFEVVLRSLKQFA